MGGTRFAGKALVEDLVSCGYKVTVISRNTTGCPAGAEQIIEEREKGLKKIQGSDFDVCFDFIGYNFHIWALLLYSSILGTCAVDEK